MPPDPSDEAKSESKSNNEGSPKQIIQDNEASAKEIIQEKAKLEADVLSYSGAVGAKSDYGAVGTESDEAAKLEADVLSNSGAVGAKLDSGAVGSGSYLIQEDEASAKQII